MTNLYKNAYLFLLRLFTNKETLYTEPIQSDKRLRLTGFLLWTAAL